MSERLFQHTKQEEHCPVCNALLQVKQGKKGLFLGCSAYPACDYLRPLQPHSESKILKVLEQQCPECQHPLVLKQGHFGMFIGCSNYPECHFVVHDEPEEQAQETVPCPECQKGELVARRGRQGKVFYGCNRYPQCKFTLPSKPYLVACPACESPVCTLKKETETHRTFQCANKSCRHIFDSEI
ncbi:DNA topoisomerase family protein [Pasteurella canis]|uniref:DNA topoisomerase family protein n=1 Tax=Pasteurella canis TaxID=753 RepID=UPI000D9E448D|nr:type I DNA topoisomerase [Pasteurella canis]SPY34014.1 DNA topoisomerase, type IA, zinc finger family protein [Pasteurella canis]